MKRRTFSVPARAVMRAIPHIEEAFLPIGDPDAIAPAIELTLPNGERRIVYGSLTDGQTTVRIRRRGLFGRRLQVIV